jgi:uncharacterized membrane protein
MLGIRGLDPVGAAHMAFGLAAVILGLAVVLMEKGSAVHRRVGMVYVLTMLLLNVTALLIYDLWGRWGPFHNFALVSLTTLLCGIAPAWLRRPQRWLRLHATFMSWSYAGLLAAFFSEIGTRLPGVGHVPGVIVPSAVVTAMAAVLIHTKVPRMVARLISRSVYTHARDEEPYYG